MILQLHLESVKNPQIYRKIHIAPERSFFDLDFTISIVFELLTNAGMEFTVVRSNGQEESGPVISILEANDELLEEWFSQPGDEVLCHIEDFESDLKIKLEQFVEDTTIMHESTFVEGQGDLKSNRPKKINTDEMNMVLSMQDVVMDSIDSYLTPDYLTLFELADELKKMKPWKYFENEEIIALQFEEQEETLFVSVMGAGGQEYGLMIYDEDLGYTALSKVLSGKPLPEDFRYDLYANVVAFVDRSELEDTDYELIKSCGLSYRGKNNWIQLRSYEAGTYPSIPLFTDVEIMTEVVAAMIKVTQLRMQGWQYPELNEQTYPVFIVQKMGELGEPFALEKIPNDGKQPLLIEINDIEKMHYKRKPKHNIQIEFDMFYLPFPIMEEENERPVYPLVIAVMDRATEEIIDHNIIPFPKLAPICQELFWGFLKEISIKPSKIFVSKDMKNNLVAVAKTLGIELVESELPGISEFKEAMKMMPPFE